MDLGLSSEGRAVVEGWILVVGFVIMGQSWEVLYIEVRMQVWDEFVVVCICFYFWEGRNMQQWGQGVKFKQGAGANPYAIPGAGSSEASSSFFFCVPDVVVCV